MERAIKIPTAIAVPLLAGYLGAYWTSHQTIAIVVQDKNTVFERPVDPGSGYSPHNWLIYTDRGVFEVKPSVLNGEFSAAERYHALKVGGAYRVLVAGWRLPAFNWYPNIVRIEGPQESR